MSEVSRDISRRAAVAWMLKAAAAGALAPRVALGGSSPPAAGMARGYGADPDLQKTYQPGELWPLTLSAVQRLAAACLCDEIIPADSGFPAASAVGVVDFIDEWVSAPYEEQQSDRERILNGLSWTDDESRRRFGRIFAQADGPDRAAICDALCSVAKAPAGLTEAALFFARFRDLTAGAYYSSPVGFKDLGYVGNTPQASFAGPPDAVLRKAGLL